MPSFENDIDQIGPSKPVMVRCNAPVVESHSSTRPLRFLTPSLLRAIAIVCPSRETAVVTCGALGSVRRRCPDAVTEKASTMRTPEHNDRRKVITHFSHKRHIRRKRNLLCFLCLAKFDLCPRFDIEKAPSNLNNGIEELSKNEEANPCARFVRSNA